MHKDLKHRIRRLCRNQFLIASVGLTALGLSLSLGRKYFNDSFWSGNTSFTAISVEQDLIASRIEFSDAGSEVSNDSMELMRGFVEGLEGSDYSKISRTEYGFVISAEPPQNRSILTGVFFGCSLGVLGLSIFTFYQLKRNSDIPASSYFIAFLPEDYGAELAALNSRLAKRNVSPRRRNLRLLGESIVLFKVFYIQMPLENLFLPSDDHSIDD